MRNYDYKIRIFKCPDCGNKMYAPKNVEFMTHGGHKKKMFCAFCKDIKNMTQIGVK